MIFSETEVPGKTVTAGKGTFFTSTVSIVVIIGFACASSMFWFMKYIDVPKPKATITIHRILSINLSRSHRINTKYFLVVTKITIN